MKWNEIRPVNPQAHQMFVDHDWQDSAIREQFIYAVE